MIKRIEFIGSGLPNEMLTELIYKVPSRQYDKDQLIFKPGDPMNTTQII